MGFSEEFYFGLNESLVGAYVWVAVVGLDVLTNLIHFFLTINWLDDDHPMLDDAGSTCWIGPFKRPPPLPPTNSYRTCISCFTGFTISSERNTSVLSLEHIHSEEFSSPSQNPVLVALQENASRTSQTTGWAHHSIQHQNLLPNNGTLCAGRWMEQQDKLIKLLSLTSLRGRLRKVRGRGFRAKFPSSRLPRVYLDSLPLPFRTATTQTQV